jgi:hypothetical protein
MTLPSRKKALEAIKKAARNGDVISTRHRKEDEHKISADDQYCAILSAMSVTWKPAEQNWELEGRNRDGKGVTIIFDVVGEQVTVITAFGARKR